MAERPVGDTTGSAPKGPPTDGTDRIDAHGEEIDWTPADEAAATAAWAKVTTEEASEPVLTDVDAGASTVNWAKRPHLWLPRPTPGKR